MFATLVRQYQKAENFFGSLKFAVVIILLFAVCLTYGTFMESYHGADYANRLVYKAPWFMGIQLLMFLSILAASLKRFPSRPALYGFHTIHLGLMVLFLGSFITYQAGVDGNLTLAPNTPARQVSLNQDELALQFPSQNKEVTVPMPGSAGERELGLEWEGIKLLRFLPFAEEELTWKRDPDATQGRLHSSQYRLANPNFGETLTLSLHPQADYPSTTQLGPLSVHYMPFPLAECFGRPSPRGLLVWDARSGTCWLPGKNDFKVQKGLNGRELYLMYRGGETLRFFPDLSPLPLDRDMKILEDSPYRVFGRALFEEKPHLFLFGGAAAWYDKAVGAWKSAPLEAGKPVDLPWMGFTIKLLEHHPDAYPTLLPQAVKPVQDNGQLVKGAVRAVELEAGGQRFWIKQGQPMSLERPDGKVIFELRKQGLKLPFEITLDRFKMDTDPGTNNPASYESFVSLFKGDAGTEKHHVYMNHPLKHGSFTFYQASYFQTEQGPYGSVFSVNYDPGRPWKYAGSLLLVLGTIWHFRIRARRAPKANHA